MPSDCLMAMVPRLSTFKLAAPVLLVSALSERRIPAVYPVSAAAALRVQTYASLPVVELQ